MWPALGREKERLQPVGPRPGFRADAMWKRPGLMPRLAAVFLDEIFSRDSYSSSSQNHKTENQTFFSLFPRSLKFLRRHGSMG